MIVGIDPGASGAIAGLPEDGRKPVAYDMPVFSNEVDAATVAHLLRHLPAQLVVIEAVHAFPKQGVSGVFRFGQAYGTVLGVCAALCLPVKRVSPARWKKFFNLSSDKEKSRRLAIETWPEVAERLARKRDERRAEAMLLALWGLRQK